MNDPNTATFSTAVVQAIGYDEYSCLLSLLPDAFYEAAQEVQDKLWRDMYLLLIRGETLENTANAVNLALTLAAEIALAINKNVNQPNQPKQKEIRNEPDHA